MPTTILPRQLLAFTGITGVANSGTATCRIPTGYRYHDLRLLTTVAGAAADPATVISEVTVTVNGRQMINTTPAEAISLAKLFRLTPSTGELPIYLTEPWRPERVATMNSWFVSASDNAVITVRFLNPGGGAVGLHINAACDQTPNLDSQGRPFLRVMKRSTYIGNVAAGAFPITDLDNEYPIVRLLITPSAGTVSQIEVKADGEIVYEATKQDNADLLNSYLITASNFEFPPVFDYPNNGGGILANNLIVKPTFSVANTCRIHVMSLVPGYL